MLKGWFFYGSHRPEDSKSYFLSFFFFPERWKVVTDSMGPHLALRAPPFLSTTPGLFWSFVLARSCVKPDHFASWS
jgi:hypothetical protein